MTSLIRRFMTLPTACKMNTSADPQDMHLLLDSTPRNAELPSLLRDFLADSIYHRNADMDHDLGHESEDNELACSEHHEDVIGGLGGLLGHCHSSQNSKFDYYDYYSHLSNQHEFRPHEMRDFVGQRRDEYREFQDFQQREERFSGMAGAAPEYYPIDPFPNTLLFPEQPQVAQSNNSSIYSNSVKRSIKKRQKHVGKACQHCKIAHLACDVQRPCKRCVHLQKQDCIDVEHKKRGRPRSVRVKE
jgi:hypothetical protein